MLPIKRPWCGPRDDAEFHCGGEAHIAFPENLDALTEQQWADYLFMRSKKSMDYSEGIVSYATRNAA